jgi:mRNA-degrading endonuclease toxin of MazEF toxin-antitoxin module
VKRGDVYWCDLEKKRSVVILTRNALIPHLSSLTVALLTTRIRGVAGDTTLVNAARKPRRCGKPVGCVRAMV